MFVQLLLSTVYVGVCFGANILYMDLLPSPSHHIWNKAIALELTSKGHNVTILTHHEVPSKIDNYTVVSLEGIYNYLKTVDYAKLFNTWTVFSSSAAMYDILVQICEMDLQTQGFSTLMNYPKDYKFDLIIYDIPHGVCLYPVVDRFGGPPIVGVAPFQLPMSVSYDFGNSMQASYSPFYISKFTDKMSFRQRAFNYFYYYSEAAYYYWVYKPRLTRVAKKYFGDKTRNVEDYDRNISIVLANIDPVLNYPQMLPPNIIPVAGVHIKPPKPLSQEIESLLESSKHGVILFSLGTNIRSDQLGTAKQSALLKAFSQLKETVLWKFESDSFDKSLNVPKNVIIRKWLPLNDILVHPKVKLFFTHGGALSCQEAIYYGVPMVGMPFMIDQHGNVAKLVHKNFALALDSETLTEDGVLRTIREVLDNPKYRMAVKEASRRFRDQINSPLERAIFWIEYVLRHGDAHHLNVASRDMPFYVSSGLDILAVAVIALYLLRRLVRGGRNQSPSSVSSNKKNK